MNTIDSILQTLAEYLASAPALREAAFRAPPLTGGAFCFAEPLFTPPAGGL